MACDFPEFYEHGWLRLRGVFSAAAAEAMRATVWRALEEVGIDRARPSSWTVERPRNLQPLKADAVFREVGSPALLAAIEAILEHTPYRQPEHWGAVFLAFPSKTLWTLPTRGWHIDAYYASPLWPARGVKTFALFGNVVARGGATLLLSGSHRLVHRWFTQNPPPRRARSAKMRALLRSQPYLRDLHTDGDADERLARFMRCVEDVEGIPLQVVEAIGDAGDVILVHPLLMHVAASNNSPAPRFMLSGGVTTDGWGWQ
jgi:ectoine hydroxylase-related dioxygenase (phytanoyl-CoA dioxygenase family)